MQVYFFTNKTQINLVAAASIKKRFLVLFEDFAVKLISKCKVRGSQFCFDKTKGAIWIEGNVVNCSNNPGKVN
ncbi:hypothetical protein BWI96_13175 [Siphonobacter sp. SORGH_AS_0500]|nr:hypothetical protein BWI96_13175 [Siphonobacter sp. SORGH_AS_0500]